MSTRDEEVRRLDVDDSLRMCGVERISNLHAQIEHHLDLHRLAGDNMPKRLSLQQFHGNEGSSTSLIDFVNRADVRVVQRGCSLGLPAGNGLEVADPSPVRREET